MVVRDPDRSGLHQDCGRLHFDARQPLESRPLGAGGKPGPHPGGYRETVSMEVSSFAMKEVILWPRSTFRTVKQLRTRSGDSSVRSFKRTLSRKSSSTLSI